MDKKYTENDINAVSRPPTIMIELETYYQLVREAKFLDALKAAGVDNWEGYSEAIDILQEEGVDESD